MERKDSHITSADHPIKAPRHRRGSIGIPPENLREDKDGIYSSPNAFRFILFLLFGDTDESEFTNYSGNKIIKSE